VSDLTYDASVAKLIETLEKVLAGAPVPELQTQLGPRTTSATRFYPTAAFSPSARRSPLPGDTMSSPIDGMTYIWIPAGSLTMGCSQGDAERFDDETPAHEVAISNGFWIGQTPVTQAAYERVTGKNPSHFKGANLPLEMITWEEAQAYSQAIGGRLPTEAEWEYAARADSREPRYGDLERMAWYAGNSDNQTHEVGLKQPNAWGLHDTLGNVWEWIADWYGEKYYAAGESRDPAGPSSGIRRALRGGSCFNNPRFLRVSVRGKHEPHVRASNVGFRCVANSPL
jgi:formylglycine-generating enzyme required for sulfatase activity